MGDLLQMKRKPLHIAMYPWFAMGHLTSFLHISNKLADRGHKISFFIPPKTEPKLKPFNRHPTRIAFLPVPVPAVPGLPAAAETTADVSNSLIPLIATAMDLTRPAVEATLRALQPDLVFFDFAHWLPEVCRNLGMKSVLYCTVSPTTTGYMLSPARKMLEDVALKAADFTHPPPGFPPPAIGLFKHEAIGLAAMCLKEFGSPGLSFSQRLSASRAHCDAIGFKACKEMDGAYCDYISEQYKKPVLLAGPVVPRPPPDSPMDEKWSGFLDKFDPGTVIYCALGSECVLELEQFHELILGLELAGMPFLAAVKAPVGTDSMDSAWPEGFRERVGGRGVVYGGWVQQLQVLEHAAVGCFVTHCGSGSMSEGMVSECQLVLLPISGDQFINARMMGMGCMKVGVEVEKGEEDGRFQRHGVAEAVRRVMEKGRQVGEEARRNHKKWQEILLTEGLERSHIDGFVEELYGLLGKN